MPLCESWMPEYDGEEIYGQTADVRLIDFIREEKKFASIDELKSAIAENGKTALKTKIHNKLVQYKHFI